MPTQKELEAAKLALEKVNEALALFENECEAWTALEDCRYSLEDFIPDFNLDPPEDTAEEERERDFDLPDESDPQDELDAYNARHGTDY